MSVLTANRAVVCDDDQILRGVIGRLLTDVGFDVQGEADSPAAALAELERTHAGTLILDLALRGGHGEHLLREVHETKPDVRVVVFSSYVSNPMALFDDGAAAVVEKPDFTKLEEVVSELIQAGTVASNRRRPTRELQPLPSPTALSLSGFEPWPSFLDMADRLLPGDAILVLDILPPFLQQDLWDAAFYADYRIALGRAVARLRREQDRVALSPDGLPVMAIINGHPEAPGAVYSRIEQHWSREVAIGTPAGAFATVPPNESPITVLDRVLRTIADGATTPDHPLRLA